MLQKKDLKKAFRIEANVHFDFLWIAWKGTQPVHYYSLVIRTSAWNLQLHLFSAVQPESLRISD